METPEQEKPPTRRPSLLVLSFLLLAGLLVAPPTRTLFQAQLHMLRDSGPYFP
ncbi:MAG: hypothetical protein JWN14_96, partial [Chthonomonadales bacterium]|nr:hypothetical protein [Chthonomonadales bacterium]